jgi:hypothetical protein
MNQEEMLSELDKWHQKSNFSDKNFWSRDIVGRKLKQIMVELGRWRHLGPGTHASKKGYASMRRKLAIENGWVPPEE